MSHGPTTRVRYLMASMAVIALIAGAGCSGDDANAATKPKKSTTTEPATTTEAPATTAAATPVVAPLLGTAVDEATAARLGRPALAVKVDNSPQAQPQDGINAADMVVEIKVEGISRLMPVFHSQDAASIGPTRSARYSDPDILALFGKPLFGWSGANDGVHVAVDNTPWIVNVNWERYIKDYKRRSDRKAPHNLFTTSAALFGHAQPGQTPPVPIFGYLAEGEANAAAQPGAGASLSVGTTKSQWAWDAAAGRYVRWQDGRVHRTNEGQAWATNVVILDTTYSKGASPIATTTGVGSLMVLTGGTVVTGVWGRASREVGYSLLDANGQPIKLTPGRTWIELPDPGRTSVLDADTASRLLSSSR